MDIGDGPQTKFYGIQVPDGATIPEGIVVESFYTSKVEVLKILRKVKSARMKEFSTSEQAVDFSKTHSADVKTNECSGGDSQKGGPESLPFNSLRIQDLLKLKQAVEKGDINRIHELVDSNPRYLIASGDTPAIVQERYRYNCLHCASLKGQTDAAEVILNYLSDESFYAKLYPDDSRETRRNRMSYLLDLYLNTPEKGRNETPLHFASQFGHVGVVKLLANEIAMDTGRVNKDGLTAAQVACTRAANSSSKQQILNILEGQYYVPLFRSDGDDVMPVVGEPWSPGCGDSPFLSDLTNPLRSVHQYKLPAIAGTLADRLAVDGSMSVKAVAGPMSPAQAAEFKKTWSCPGITITPKGKPPHRPSPLREVLRRDPYKGQELIGRNVASEMEVPWCEFWEFLGCSVDMRQPEGLKKLEDYLISLESSQENTSSMCAGDVDEVDSAVSSADVPGQAADTLNSTDEQLSSLFKKLSIHSPSSPGCRSHAICTSNQLADSHSISSSVSSSQNVGAENVHPQSVHITASMPVKRSRLESVWPVIAPFMDKLRMFWPFGKGGFSPKTSSPMSFSEPDNYTKLKSTDNVDASGDIALSLSDINLPQYRPTVYLKGAKPCKVDSDVVKALEGVNIDPSCYPAIHHWHSNVTRFSEKDRNGWESPVVIKHRQRLRYLIDNDTPRRRLKMDT